MGSTMQNLLFTLLLIGGSITAFVLLMVFVAVPLFRGIGAGIGFTFHAIGWFFSHIFEFIIGTCSDLIRFIGALIAMVVLLPLVPLNILIGRWSAAGHFGEGVKRECQVGAACVYRAAIRRPLKLLLLQGLLEGLEQRVPEAMHGAPGGDKPSRRVGQFDGYTILGSLRAGGSGAKLYVAEPDANKMKKHRGMPNRVVIKSFAITEGSSLPQIVRESRALECAKQMGLVFDHGMDEHRFFYVMPYHPGEHLGILTRQMHGECGGRGLDQKRLNLVMSYTHDLLATLSGYHKGGLWHKDVKPENVIVHDSRAHLVDLGLVTPLKSAMTLTTHGTEYFRDPEMVRQALRGVKVHQVDGAKFDIYAAGAVLYFMIENTFPAHGGLSRFAAKSPEALRWIVRRAMTEYHQRYTSADEMLRDLDFVAASSDAYAVKPADLPSMRGEAVMEESAHEPNGFAARAGGSSFDDVIKLAKDGIKVAKEGAGFAGVIAGARGVGYAHVGVGKFGMGATPEEAVAAAHVGGTAANPAVGPKPRINVTNWWTGAYSVDDAASAGDASHDSFSDSSQFRAQAKAFRAQAREIGRQARTGVMSARKAARAQVKAARQRARDLRERARAHRHRVARQPNSVSAIVIGTLSVLFLSAIILTSIFAVSNSARSDRRATASSSTRAGLPVLFAIDSSVPLNDSLRAQIKRIASDYRNRGYDVIDDAQESVAPALSALRNWEQDSNGPADTAIEDFLQAQNAYGVVHVRVEKNRRGRPTVDQALFVHSTRPDAELRRRISGSEIPAPPSSGMPYLLINDHPAKADVAVAAEIERRLKAYREKGWSLISNDDVEVKVRQTLPVGPIDDKTLSPTLHATLAQADLGGILRIDGKTENLPVAQRVFFTRIDRDMSVPAPPKAPAAPGPTEVPQAPATSAAIVSSGAI